MRNVKQNLFFAFVYNALGVPIAAGVLYPVFGLLLSPIFAGAAMAMSSVSVVTQRAAAAEGQAVTRDYHYVWLLWSSAFLVPWAAIYFARPAMRRHMLRVSAATSLLGLTEPIFVPEILEPAEPFRSGAAHGLRHRELHLLLRDRRHRLGALQRAGSRDLRLVPQAARPLPAIGFTPWRS